MKKPKRGQALYDRKPDLKVLSPAKGPCHPGRPVPANQRGTQYAPRNAMHDTEPFRQEEGSSSPIRTQLLLKGVR